MSVRETDRKMVVPNILTEKRLLLQLQNSLLGFEVRRMQTKDWREFTRRSGKKKKKKRWYCETYCDCCIITRSFSTKHLLPAC